MERALRNAVKPVETLYLSSEGHGFYTDEHRREYYRRLLDFLARNLGGAGVASGTTAK
jgi:dipeptidyl aminopeptidase/acylaminoacyl peptidase